MSIVSGVGASPSVGPTSGGKVYAINNLSTGAEQVIGANQSRVSVTFYNPGTVDAFVGPVNVINSSGQNTPLSPSYPSALGGTFRVLAGGGFVTLNGECQGAYQGLSVSGTGNPLTVIDSNV